MEDKNHVWSAADNDGVRSCLSPDCTIRVGQTGQWWQRKKGAHWRDTEREEFPFCVTRKAKA